ncbi:helix-turn-helix domain-containing protein [Fictibacillus sp. KU28468]|uniref:helix-turn-helix domain-containing protein n=1 Tax=Fictibacillus sp. KU28468 TaxID=2991053 RepID=UPI00223DE518|nr:helix-turn-helix transcriptional regulator [Fictibacillus sp. KU28468]UZJ80555.1 helix-turn-helix domain-containing protein [Fictibacillus sp. KU28468]
MTQDFGQKIRINRTKKGISLHAFAEQIGVSSGYLSQLETGKTQKIDLPLFDKINKELHIFSTFTPD